MKLGQKLLRHFRSDSDIQDIPALSGIYQIHCVPTGKIYVGSAKNLRERWRRHKSALRKHKHSNSHLQSAWDKYGENHFEFIVLEFVHREADLLPKEQEWIEKTNCTNRDYGFNIFDQAGSPGNAFVQTWEGFIDPSGQEIIITNLFDFCRQNGLDNASMIRLAQGRSKLKSHKGWTHKNSVRQRDYIKTWEGFIDPDGHPVGTITNLAAFCREHDLDDTHMIALAKGKLHTHKGWTHLNKREYSGHKTYTGFVNPEGYRVVITNLQDFCRKNNLHPVHMHQLISGERKSHHGWTWKPENENE